MLDRLETIFQEVAKNISVRIFQQADQVLTHPQYFMLKRLFSGPATVSEVAEFLGVSLSAVTSMAGRLVKTGYLVRARSEDDRRLVWLKLTDSGRRALEESSRQRKEVIQGVLGRLGDEELRALYGVYTRMLELMGKDGN